MLRDEIVECWKALGPNRNTKIPSLEKTEFPAIALKFGKTYGVAVPVTNNNEISERFADAHIYTSTVVINSVGHNALLLMSKYKGINIAFANLCAEFVDPGENGAFRKQLVDNPSVWWKEWKDLLGNINGEDRVYDVIAELYTYKYLLIKKSPILSWHGPEAGTYDLECDGEFFEVKSTISRKEKKITLSNKFQLIPPHGALLHLIFCEMEPAQSGYSINSLVDDLSNLGLSRAYLNDELESLGYEVGKSARNRHYILHEMLQYEIDNSFPALRNTSFKNDIWPFPIQDITYTLSLDSLVGKKLL